MPIFRVIPGRLSQTPEDRELERRERRFGARTAQEVLDRWDRGDTVWSVEMGGLGPGYEQRIQITAFEILRELLDRMRDDVQAAQSKAVARLDRLGLSGTQTGAATDLAEAIYRCGYREVLESVPGDRLIQVKRDFLLLDLP